MSTPLQHTLQHPPNTIPLTSIHLSSHSTSHPLKFIALIIPCNYCTFRYLITHYNPLKSCQNSHTHTSSYIYLARGSNPSTRPLSIASRIEVCNSPAWDPSKRAGGAPCNMDDGTAPPHHVLVDPLFNNRSPRSAAQFDSTRPQGSVLVFPHCEEWALKSSRTRTWRGRYRLMQSPTPSTNSPNATMPLFGETYTSTTIIPAHSIATYPLLCSSRTPEENLPAADVHVTATKPSRSPIQSGVCSTR